ncbi:catechol 2,3-dioxygenase-like lactoylglutathione lyase family enzyme [Paraburkholderia terricola]|nr:catechol 2,3-dioxygenase-like lactoylglutathione lyase family enzyme [Paraburkholderia terricola]
MSFRLYSDVIGAGIGPPPMNERPMMTAFIDSMKLNHLSFPSADTPATAQFFEQYLGFTIAGTWDQSYILKRPGFDVVIDHASGDAPAWPKAFHVGFELPSLDAVHALYERFKTEGVEMETEVFNNGRGSRFFCRAPGGVMFEINTRRDAAPEYRGTFDD